DRRPVRAGVRRPAHLLEEQGGLDHAEAAAAVRLGQREAEPAELRDLLPQRVALTARVVPQEAHRRGLHMLVEEPAGRVLQEPQRGVALDLELGVGLPQPRADRGVLEERLAAAPELLRGPDELVERDRVARDASERVGAALPAERSLRDLPALVQVADEVAL